MSGWKACPRKHFYAIGNKNNMSFSVKPIGPTGAIPAGGINSKYIKSISGSFIEMNGQKGRIFYTDKKPDTAFLVLRSNMTGAKYSMMCRPIESITHFDDLSHTHCDINMNEFFKELEDPHNTVRDWLKITQRITREDLLENAPSYFTVTVEAVFNTDEQSCNYCKKFNLLDGICREGCANYSTRCFEHA